MDINLKERRNKINMSCKCRICDKLINIQDELNYYNDKINNINNIDENVILDIIENKKFHLKCLQKIECNFDPFEKIVFRFSLFKCPKCGHKIITRGGKIKCTNCGYMKETKNFHHCDGCGYEETNSVGDFVWKCPKCGREERRVFESNIECNEKCQYINTCEFKNTRLKKFLRNYKIQYYIKDHFNENIFIRNYPLYF